MMQAAIADWDDAYANGAHIAGAADYPPRWEAEAAAFRAGLGDRARLNLKYGEGARQVFDLFHPEGASKGLFAFIHGGYWRAFSKETWSHLAAGALAQGWTVAMPSYTLAPEAPISAISAEIAKFLTVAAPTGRLRLAGHSAGGHLATRMLCVEGPAPDALRARIEHVLSISGVHDLRPLMRTAMNDDLRLDAAEAAAESPALLTPEPGAQVTCLVGAAERPEFVRQNALLANVWRGLGAATEVIEAPGLHHFDVIDALKDPDAPILA